MKLGEIIKKFRYDNDMTMQEFADKSGLSKGYISMLEKNKHPQSKRELVPSFETYKKVASAMCMPLDDFLAALDGDEVVKVNAAAPAPAQLVGNVESVNNFGDRLHSLRKSKSLTQEAFASSLNERYDLKINKSMVSKWENNIDTPSLNSAKYISIFFDVSLDYLLGVSDDKQVARAHMNIGEIIKNRRKELGMSAEDVAEIIGASPATIYRYESNYITKMGIDKLTPIAKALRVSEAYLMGWTTDPNWRPDSDVSLSATPADPLQLTEQEKHIISIYHDLDRVGQEKFTAFGEGLLSAARAEDMRGHYTFTPYENYMVAESGPEYQMWSNKVNDQLMEDADRIAKKEIENASNTKKMVK